MSRTLKLHGRVLRRWRILCTRLRSFGYDIPSSPIIVLGNQKSGTTAIAALLAMYIGKSATLDMPALWYALEGLFIGRRELREFVKAYKAYFSREVIKEPWLTFLVWELVEIFPQARYVLVVRDPRDNIRSILDRLDLPGDASTNPPELDALGRGWREVFDPKWLRCDSTHYIDVLAHRWNWAASVPQRQQRLTITVVRYEDFVTDKQGTIAHLAKVLGEEGRNDISGYLDKSFQPRGARRHLSWTEFFGKSNLRRIEERCRELMRVYGYEGVVES